MDNFMIDFTNRDTFVVFSIKGKQYKASINDEILIDKIDVITGKNFIIEENILLIGNKKKTIFGTPNLKKILLSCIVLKQIKSIKIT